MVLVHTSVWVDYFNGIDSAQVRKLDELLGSELVLIGDLILAELLQGFATDRDAQQALRLLEALDYVDMAGRDVALESAHNYRSLRQRGLAVRKTMDMLIGTFCLLHGHELLHADRDFDTLRDHLGLRVVALT